ncbi:MAG: proline racemase family protein [Methylobacteriaceae bacterium]|nr:proline racemase family protein [Methylobacteriaceae bacterium]
MSAASPRRARAPAALAAARRVIETLDMHTAGEPVRIVTGGYPNLPGATILDKRRVAAERHDHLRTAIMHEPRGHAGMYGVIPVRPSLPGADLACLFTHASGYSTMCGHATIAIGRWAVEAGLVRAEGERARFGLELPCGLVEVEARLEGERVVAAAFESVPAWIERRAARIDVEGHGAAACDIVFGGAFYAILPASRLGVDFSAGLPALTAAAKAAFAAARRLPAPVHPESPDLSFLYGVILTDDAPAPEISANLCLFGEGQIDRSPTGSGVTARTALDLLSGRIEAGVGRRFVGPTGGAFDATARRVEPFAGHAAARVRGAGQSVYAGTSRFVVEAEDRLGDGFLLFASETA